MSPQGYAPRSLLFQWHLTERCNLRCAHCYQDHYIRDGLKFAELIDIFSQFKALLAVQLSGRLKIYLRLSIG
ncbi:MAG: hypothetical protein SVR94_05715 [Pseudomonadota bacterium]|nr:hypothetical protein [Pseudomonadota bacterium]